MAGRFCLRQWPLGFQCRATLWCVVVAFVVALASPVHACRYHGHTCRLHAPPDAVRENAPASASTKASSKEGASAPIMIPMAGENDPEVMLGRQNVEQMEREIKLYTEAATVERVNRIGQELAAIANATPLPALWGTTQQKQFRYVFKIVDDKDPNAFALPGGFIYVHKGLLDMVRSDDELAGVLAHEVAHVAHHHIMKLMREQKKVNQALLPIQILAVLLAGLGQSNAGDLSNIYLGTQLYTIAKMNTYGIEAEKDADNMAIYILKKSGYNPVGLYSFMRRLAELEKRRGGNIDLGIYRTHPPSEERREAARTLLTKLDIPILLSEVDPTLQTHVVITKQGVGGAELAEVRLREILICRVPGAEGMTAEQRGRQIASRINLLLDTNLQPFEVRINRDQTKLILRGQLLMTREDADAQNSTLAAIARAMSDAIARISQRRQLNVDL